MKYFIICPESKKSFECKHFDYSYSIESNTNAFLQNSIFCLDFIPIEFYGTKLTLVLKK